MPENKKPLLKSRTFWLNILMTAGSVASGAFGIPIPPKIAIPVAAAANIGVRILTDSPIGSIWQD